MMQEAIILAGGKGTRLQAVVSDVPKPMAPIGEKPFLFYQMKYLISRGIDRIILSVGYKSEVISDYFGNEFQGVPLVYVHEENPLGTGGGVRLALNAANSNEVLVCNGDTFFEFELSKLQFAHRQFQGTLTFSVHEIENNGRYGGMRIGSDAKVNGFIPKNVTGKTYINAGIYLINKTEFLAQTPADTPFSLEDDFLAVKVGEGRFYACPFSASQFIDIGIPEDYEKGQSLIPTWSSKESTEFKTVFLDRDGVLNRKIDNGYVTKPEELEILPGVRETLKEWGDAGKEFFIVTNQRGVGRGLMTIEELHAVHFTLLKKMEAVGVKIRDIKFCTDTENSSPCRKPNPGMLLELFKEYPHIEKDKVIFIGDSLSDLQAGKNAGVKTAFLTNDKPLNFEVLQKADHVSGQLSGLRLN
ncbi:HAD-IIIA family hydrolase [Jiulongibacter sediminis]|jgi:D-glycero-alpha-D-manno-heptose 1-phosphate guanylyltransferase|uniref:HAD-IIIA family hydrolase n=1 Tax=Jiulongibacter sediminis TaxID=1605367 RepID=UPI0026EB16A7|nr:HAD-IIIA family hydrolase [Jiulongibacter sediminis]